MNLDKIMNVPKFHELNVLEISTKQVQFQVSKYNNLWLPIKKSIHRLESKRNYGILNLVNFFHTGKSTGVTIKNQLSS